MSLSLRLSFVLLPRPFSLPPPFLIIFLIELEVKAQLVCHFDLWLQESLLRLLLDFHFAAVLELEQGVPEFQSPRLWPCLLLNSS